MYMLIHSEHVDNTLYSYHFDVYSRIDIFWNITFVLLVIELKRFRFKLDSMNIYNFKNIF